MANGSNAKTRRRLHVLRRGGDSAAAERRAAFVRAVHEGLAGVPKDLSRATPADRVDVGLLDEIRESPDYYLARAERQVLASHAAEIAARFRDGPPLFVELGVSDRRAVRPLIASLLTRHGRLHHVTIDLTIDGLEARSLGWLEEFPRLEATCVEASHGPGLLELTRTPDRPRVILWLGSAIGAFDRIEAAAALHAIGRTMRAEDVLLLGIDLRKDARALERAYADSSKLMARRNLALLTRINESVGADFDTSRFRHRAVFAEELGRVETSVVSRRRQTVCVEGLERPVSFAKGEGMLTEVAYKYSPSEIDALAQGGGMIVQDRWYDREGRFSLNLMRHVRRQR